MEKALALFAKENPRTAIYLQNYDPLPLEEIDLTKWSENIHSADVLFVWGLHGVYQQLKNYKGEVVVMEDDLQLLASFLDTEIALQLLKNPKWHLYALENEKLYQWLAWGYFDRKYSFAVHPTKDVDPSKLEFELAQKFDIADEYLKFGIVYYRNFYKNLRVLSDSYDGQKLYRQFEGVPAIIVGAGPSLDHITLPEEGALIFAGGSALNALHAKGILPHFGVGIDPNPLQLERVRGRRGQKCPFFYRSRMHHEALQEVEGKHLYIPGGGGYDTSLWFEDQLGIEGEEIDEGHNVVNFSIGIAKKLGCSPIYLVGVDLGYTDMKSYSEGVDSLQPNLDGSVLRLDIHGNALHTTWKWLAEAEWISQQGDVLNATGGGLPIPNILNVELPKFSPLPDLQEKIDKLVQDSKFSFSAKLVEQKIQEFSLYMKDARSVLQTLQEQSLPMHEIELSENPAYIYALEMFNTIYVHVLNHRLQRGENKRKLNNERYLFLQHVAEVNLKLAE